jgi:hypothetical protein
VRSKEGGHNLRAEAEHAVETRRQIGQPDQVIPSRIVPAGDENRDALFDKIMSFLFMCRHSLPWHGPPRTAPSVQLPP